MHRRDEISRLPKGITMAHITSVIENIGPGEEAVRTGPAMVSHRSCRGQSLLWMLEHIKGLELIRFSF